MTRSSFFIDGFNFYHALRRLDGAHLKWVDLHALMKRQIPKSEAISSVYYFSAYARWLPGPHARHRQYVAALEQRGVEVILGHFKRKDRRCNSCGAQWIGHEEKETDVNIALCLLNEAYKNTFDRAYIVSRDSDLKPAISMVRAEFPEKRMFAVAPPHSGHSADLLGVSHGKKKITKKQIEECLLPASILDSGGNVVATRPKEYAPPKSG